MPRRGLSDAMPGEVPHHTGHRERLRDKFRMGGEDALANYELLELALFAAIARQDTKPLAKRILDEFEGDLSKLFSASRERLMQIDGVGDAVADQICVIGRFVGRTAKQPVVLREALSSWSALVDYCQRRMEGLGSEQFRVLFLDRKNKLIKDEVLGEGTVDHAPVYPREVVKRALQLGASAVIIVHNHPSGDPTPSAGDIEMTKQVVEAARTLDITVHDHLIIGRQGHASLKQLGLM